MPAVRRGGKRSRNGVKGHPYVRVKRCRSDAPDGSDFRSSVGREQIPAEGLPVHYEHSASSIHYSIRGAARGRLHDPTRTRIKDEEQQQDVHFGWQVDRSRLPAWSPRTAPLPVGPSTRPARSPRTIYAHPSDADYRARIIRNGIIMNHMDDPDLPQDVRGFLRSTIVPHHNGGTASKKVKYLRGKFRLPAAQVAQVKNLVRPDSEGLTKPVGQLIGTALLPVDYPHADQGRGTPYTTSFVPARYSRGDHLVEAEPSTCFGYFVGSSPSLSASHMDLMAEHFHDSGANIRGDGPHFPFLLVHSKAEAEGGTMWAAENEAAGAGASCVEAMRILIAEACGGDMMLEESMVFSACVSHRTVVFSAHWYCAERHGHYMTHVATYDTSRDVRACHATTRNIMEYGIEFRLGTVQRALEALAEKRVGR